MAFCRASWNIAMKSNVFALFCEPESRKIHGGLKVNNHFSKYFRQSDTRGTVLMLESTSVGYPSGHICRLDRLP